MPYSDLIFLLSSSTTYYRDLDCKPYFRFLTPSDLYLCYRKDYHIWVTVLTKCLFKREFLSIGEK